MNTEKMNSFTHTEQKSNMNTSDDNISEDFEKNDIR